MNVTPIIKTLVLVLVISATISTSFGIFTNAGNGQYEHKSIRGETVTIYGKGLYEHMSADVAIQGIAQDYITLFIGVPLLVVSFSLISKRNILSNFLLAGTAGYFFLTYLFYTAMAMYNKMFLFYIISLSSSFFLLVLTIVRCVNLRREFKFVSEKLNQNAGYFLVINSFMITILWLSVVVPPLIDGTIIPKQVQHYTTLIVQGYDLGLFLPMAIVSGVLAIKRNIHGYIFTIIYMIFLSLLMTALISKILFMANAGASVFPVVFIMPSIASIATILSILLLRNIKVVN